jgi:hypothetical protein
MVVRHRVFHRTLVNACGSQWLLGFRDVLHEQSERYRRLSIRRNHRENHATSSRTRRHCTAPCSSAMPTAAVARFSKHFLTTMHLVELATPTISGVAAPSDLRSSQPKSKNVRGNVTMNITRRHILATITAARFLGASASHSCGDRSHRPSHQDLLADHDCGNRRAPKLFEKEGIAAELTIYRGGAETFEAMAAGAADVILDATSLVSAGRKKGVNSKVLANAAMGYYGWQLMTLSKSPLDVKDLNSKKVAITSAGLRLRHAGAVDHCQQEDRLHPRAGRRRRPGAQLACQQRRRGGGLFAAELPDLQIGRSPHHHRLLQEVPPQPHRRLDRARQIRAGKAASRAKDAQRALRRAAVHAQQQGRLRQADFRSLRNSRRDRRAGI